MSKKLSKISFIIISFLFISCNTNSKNDITKIIFDYYIDSMTIEKAFGVYIEFKQNDKISERENNFNEYYWFDERSDTNVFIFTKDTIFFGCIIKDTNVYYNKAQIFLSPAKLITLQKVRNKYEPFFLNEFKMVIKLNEKDSLIYYKVNKFLIEYRLDGVVISVDDSVKMNKEKTLVPPPTSPDDTIF